ncbi:hypothetical protein PNI0010_00118 [Streptococcus pneumoniae PNI0010]|nr:hypothetical protein PNI0006_02318 [Streptococcus pneumoniae PNI0006]ELU77787.1 hypothetical protein PNI0010_00118 [Streptococcus pneumoniae PNI0010]
MEIFKSGLSASLETYVHTLRKSLQTTSASPCRTQVQPAASFLVCSLIFIEYQKNQLLDNFDFRVGSNPHPPPHHPLSVQPFEVNFSNDNAFAFALHY